MTTAPSRASKRRWRRVSGSDAREMRGRGEASNGALAPLAVKAPLAWARAGCCPLAPRRQGHTDLPRPSDRRADRGASGQPRRTQPQDVVEQPCRFIEQASEETACRPPAARVGWWSSRRVGGERVWVRGMLGGRVRSDFNPEPQCTRVSPAPAPPGAGVSRRQPPAATELQVVSQAHAIGICRSIRIICARRGACATVCELVIVPLVDWLCGGWRGHGGGTAGTQHDANANARTTTPAKRDRAVTR